MTELEEIILRIGPDLVRMVEIVTAARGRQAVEGDPVKSSAELLTPGQLAARTGKSESQVRRILQRGARLGIAGIEKRGSKLWLATPAAFEVARAR